MAIEVLVRFSRMVSAAATPAEVMPLLVDAAIEHLGADGAAVLSVAGQDRIDVVASRGLPAELAAWSSDADLIGPELATRLLAACSDRFVRADVVPLVAAGDLFGVLVLLSAHTLELDPGRIELASALGDLAALAAGRAASFAALSRSYEELRASRDALARTERLRVLGQMAGGVSHDLKNILNPLGLQLELLRRRCERLDHEGALATIATMRDVIAHGVDVVERLREFSRQAPEALAEEVDIERVVVTALDLSRPRVEQHAGVELRHEPAPATKIGARASELTTAVVNLIVNAVEAMPDGGTITVRTGSDEGGGWIEVVDTGPGMPPEIEQRVFEPFFTTKSDGTGLGLAIVYAFVGRHRGRVTLDTGPGRGTRIRLWFPPLVGPR